MSRRKRCLFAAFSIAAFLIVFLVAVISVYSIWGNILDPLDFGRSLKQPVGFGGQTKEAIEAKYGKPTGESAGVFGLPDISYVKFHSRAITTTYIRFSGRLFLSFEQRQDGEWVCFDSLWCPNGVVFD